MGCEVEVYRARIGGWAARCRLELRNKASGPAGTGQFFYLVIAVLLVIGGVELNPGPRSDDNGIKCGTCKKNLRVGILCNGCERWYHLGCQKVKRELIVEETWICKDCGGGEASVQVELCKLREDMRLLREELHNAEKRIRDLEEENLRLREGVRDSNQGPGSSCVVIGDSMVRHAGDQQPDLQVECYPGIRVEEVKNMVERRERSTPDSIIIHAGTNDLRRRRVDYVMADMYDLVSATKKKFPSAAIIISGIVRRRDISWRKVGLANEAYEWVAERLGACFVDPNSWLDDGDFGRDGVHLNQSGAAALGDLFTRVAALSAWSGGRV